MYILAKGTHSCCIIMDPKLATHLVVLLTYMFIRFDVVRVMGERDYKRKSCVQQCM